MSVSVNFQELRFCCSSSISGSRIWNFTENIVLLYFLRCSIKLSWLVLRPAVYSTSTWLYGQILIFWGAEEQKPAGFGCPLACTQHCCLYLVALGNTVKLSCFLRLPLCYAESTCTFKPSCWPSSLDCFPQPEAAVSPCHTSAAKKTSLYPLLIEGKVPHCCVGKK